MYVKFRLLWFLNATASFWGGEDPELDSFVDDNKTCLIMKWDNPACNPQLTLMFEIKLSFKGIWLLQYNLYKFDTKMMILTISGWWSLWLMDWCIYHSGRSHWWSIHTQWHNEIWAEGDADISCSPQRTVQESSHFR